MEAQHIEHTLEPIFDERSRVLVLGTMPSPKSREVGFYYGHPQNRFWRVMERYSSCPAILLSKTMRVARFSSSSILPFGMCLPHAPSKGLPTQASSTRFPTISRASSARHPSRTSSQQEERPRSCVSAWDGEVLSARNIPLTGLPSTSAANARVRLDQLVEAYRPIVHAVTAGNCPC